MSFFSMYAQVLNWSSITPAFLEHAWGQWLRKPHRDEQNWPPHWPGHDVRPIYTPYWVGRMVQLGLPDVERADRQRLRPMTETDR